MDALNDRIFSFVFPSIFFIRFASPPFPLPLLVSSPPPFYFQQNLIACEIVWAVSTSKSLPSTNIYIKKNICYLNIMFFSPKEQEVQLKPIRIRLQRNLNCLLSRIFLYLLIIYFFISSINCSILIYRLSS